MMRLIINYANLFEEIINAEFKDFLVNLINGDGIIMSNPRLEPTALTLTRKAAGMNRTKLAEASGISVRTIERWEQRRSKIEDADIMKVLSVCDALDCKIEDVFDNVPDVTPAIKKDKALSTRQQPRETKMEKLRRSLGLTRVELSNLSGVEYRAVTMYEQGIVPIRNASSSIVYRLAKTLGTDIKEIFEEE